MQVYYTSAKWKKKGLTIVSVRSGHGEKFQNEKLCDITLISQL